MEKKSRKRGDNWTYEDKDLLIILMKDSSKIIDSKYGDTNTNRKKIEEWVKVQKSFCKISGTNRSIEQLKGAWRRIKMTVKDDDPLKCKKEINEEGHKSRSPSIDETEATRTCDTDSENYRHDSEDYPNENTDELDVPNDETVLIDGGTVEVVVDLIEETPVNSSPKHVSSICASREDIEIKKEEPNSKRGITVQEQKWSRLQKSRKAAIYRTKFNTKHSLSNRLIRQEYALKMKYQHLQLKHLEILQQKELSHQELRHNLEIEILSLEKRKKELEISKLENR